MAPPRAPGVYREEVTLEPPPTVQTGVPAFLGATANGGPPTPLLRAHDLERLFGPPVPGAQLAPAVAAFFENGGDRCYVVPLADEASEEGRREELERGLALLEPVDEVDLVCAPDAVRRREEPSQPLDRDKEAVPMARLQAAVVGHCDRTGDRFALLDAFPRAAVADLLEQRRTVLSLAGSQGWNAAIYHPWVRRASDEAAPPAAYVAGVVARTDRLAGVHKAPANVRLEGVIDLEPPVTAEQQAELNPHGINCLRSFPGRGIRVWGARTLGGEPWGYVSVRRVFLTAARWIDRALADAAFEPNAAPLWARIRRDLGAYFDGLYRAGALVGRTADEAFYVKCDEETNTRERREAGAVVAEVGLAPGRPNEFVVVHVVYHAGRVEIAGPAPG
jgi:hypothetical protein